ncbi:CHAP domain-containing protein [Pseudarthrobacter sp. J47]|uniref:CHAP domain-containing protein n=1 Tax=Pseudarthrobacter sp. J47 TaxID=3116482 RepID=UPI002E8230C2|nr:CHAP domain-containing protein [Pseudarthrobacter sp. J47]MEE2524538.1 CHAP domain-containing protein [Pseudarthrobacter sp. J47]
MVVAIVALIAGLFVMVVAPVIGGQAKAVAAEGPACAAPGTSGGGPMATGPLLDQQLANAKLIDQAAQTAGLSGAASRIAIIAAVGESDLINVEHGDDARNPDGTMNSSLGLFQQQWTLGWGTREQVMNPVHAATSFLMGRNHDGKGGLVSVPGWQDMEPSLAIHTVQRNADPNHYARFVNRADALIAKAGIDVNRAASAPVAGDTVAVNLPGECGGGSVTVVGDAKDDYPFRDITPGPGIYVVDPYGYFYGECTSWVAWAFNRDHGSTTAPHKFAAAAGNFANGNAADWKNAWAGRGWPISQTPQPGAVAWWGAWGGGSAQSPLHGVGGYGHVAYVEKVMPDGKVLISEYNNSFLAPPGHKFSSRVVDANEINGYLLPPT